MRVLVTGATGFIGMEVATQLAEQGLQPRLMVRRAARAPLLHHLDAEVVFGDLAAPATLRRAVEGCDAVIHLAGRAVFEPAHRLVDSFVVGTRNLAEAAAAAGVSRVVFASSLLVHGDTAEPITPDTPPAPEVDYGRVKLLVEQGLSRFGAEQGIQVANVRLPHVYGATDQLFGRVRSGLLVVPGRGANPYAHLHVADAARALIRAAEIGWSGASALGDRESVDWNTFLREIDDQFPGLQVVRAPASAALLGTAVLSGATAWRSAPSLYTPDTVRGWNLSLPVDPEALWPQLGIEPLLPTYREGIARTLNDRVAFRWRHPVQDHRSA